ncbi:hypothetical protein FZI91_23135 [Mycobacterium sp. CBMA271]|uniref:hypothetical protein n=1 Tax=unclassified Mycobacteroides TaxID=2618759 RepID=UPI0012DC13CC|nr:MULTISPECIES: hypothetical protein [unclassified Mycobacteroides]MUM18581.1 hypothetical protein [Mycobacteroides sp. CBMA 326]MUM24573.1 hypothetical protein [Mycobacteroides sp. CBMA 271]
MTTRGYLVATASAVTVSLCLAPLAIADAPEFPDVSTYQADSLTAYKHGEFAEFRTPDGLLCRLQPANGGIPTFWCYGNLPAVPAGVNAVSGTNFKRWGFLPPDVNKNAPVLPPMHSLTITGSQTNTTCVVGPNGLTACKSVISYSGGGGEETGFVASPQGSRIWRTKL